MFKAMGVVGLWVALIAAPHAASSPEPAQDPGDPGDPYALQKPPAPKPAPTSSTAGSFATIHFKNEVGKDFKLLEARVLFDDADLPVLTGVKSGEDVVLFSGRVRPGRHVAETYLTYEGGKHGIFTYMKDYKITVRADEVLTVPPETAVQFTISGKENKGANVPFNHQVGIEVYDRVPAPAK
ncbi:MAG TPA: hypothetical protein VHJ20_16275 [Polyangia bacterium]|nr:hypothetical protein [Polyangia bacterium]